MGRPRLTDEVAAQRALETREKAGTRRVILIKAPAPISSYPPPANIDFRPDVPIDFHDLIRQHPGKSVEECIADIPESLTKREAKRWRWDAADDFAISEGCRFSLRRAMHYAYTLRNNLVLWEGEWAEQPFILDSWEIECDLRIFGWVRPSEKHNGRWVRRFAKASTWVAKKNGKSPRGAAHCVYVWRFDGPWHTKKGPTIGGGSHVYCIAKNGIQAGRVWNHAKNMIEHAPLLKHELDMRVIAKNEQRSRLEYLPKHSILTIVTGDSQRARDAAEGLNARLICCDEAAVVDDRMVEVTKDAGASHEDFLWSQISTYGAGEGYGKKDLDYGKDVSSGKIKNSSYFFKAYAAPEDCTDEDCGREEIWAMANPNLGNTVSIRQMRDAYNECKDDPPQFAGFKQRRLNIWQRAINPMLSFPKWQKCATTINHDSIKGVGGGLAFDLATTGDWASVGVSWNSGENLCVWGKIWTSEAWIVANSFRAPVEKWAQDGHIEVCEGGMIDIDGLVSDEIMALIQHCGSQGVGYDVTFGLALAQRILKTHPNLHQGKFNQSIRSYAHGTSEFKNAVINGRLQHPGNPAVDWQAGHVMSRKLGTYEKPIKPERDGQEIPWMKVDTIQCFAMATGVKSLCPETGSASVTTHEPTADEIAAEEAMWNRINAAAH